MMGFQPIFLGETLTFFFAPWRLCVRQCFFQATQIRIGKNENRIQPEQVRSMTFFDFPMMLLRTGLFVKFKDVRHEESQ